MTQSDKPAGLLEIAIATAQSLPNGVAASEHLRGKLRDALALLIAKPSLENESLEECLEEARQHAEKRVAAILMLRALILPSVIPHACELAAISLFEAALPDFFKYLHYDTKAQTFEKWPLLVSAQHVFATEIMRLLSLEGSLQEIANRKQEILKGLANKVLGEFCKPYGFEQIRGEVQTATSLLSDCLQAEDANLGAVISDLRQHLFEFQGRHATPTNFLSRAFLLNFLAPLVVAVQQYDDASKSRFNAEIVSRFETSELASKRYPLLESGRTIIFTLPLENLGPGAALDVVARIAMDSDLAVTNEAVLFGDVPAGPFSLSFPILTLVPSHSLDLLIDLTWASRSVQERVNLQTAVTLSSQDPNIDWLLLAKNDSYSIEVAEGNQFVGRTEKVAAVLNRLSTARMQSTYITGQKRIGKTSLVLAVREALGKDDRFSNFEALYLEWGDYARMDAMETVMALGIEIANFLCEGLPKEMMPNASEFRGTLAPLIRLAKRLGSDNPNTRYVVMLDEFDEIHPEMYRFGPLAEAVFSNLRTLASQKNIAFILVGGEKMPFVISAQGDQLNKFIREPLDYFSRDEEWADYQDLVAGPTKNSLSWQPGAINRIFDLTNGHPYYTKLLCSRILRNAVADRDSDITRFEVDKAAALVVSGLDINAFAHYWKDGIQADKEEEESTSLLRQRVLASLAKVIRAGDSSNVESISKHGRQFNLQPHEVQLVLQDLCRRGILHERAGRYSCAVLLFSQWLCEVGANRLIVDTFGDQLADALRRSEEEAYVQAHELVTLTSTWDPYRGRRIGPEDVRAWLEQVGMKRDQRLLLKILQAIRFVSEVEIRKMLKLAYSMLTSHVKPFVKGKRADRRSDILVVYVDGEGKSGQQYASKFAEENQISSWCVMNSDNFVEKAALFENRMGVTIDAVVVIDDIIGTGNSLSTNLQAFANAASAFMNDRSAMLAVIVLLATSKGEQRVRKVMKEFSFPTDLRICESIENRHFAFGNESKVWKDATEADRAKALCLEAGTRVYKKQPLGFGDEGLLVVFPVTCPNNSLPILHSRSKTTHKWMPLFERPVN